MEGRARAARRDHEKAIFLAWHAAAFTSATQSKRGLKPLAHYLSAGRVQRQGAAEMMATLRDLNSRGAQMTIRRVETDANPS